jgi:hypothetical protein
MEKLFLAFIILVILVMIPLLMPSLGGSSTLKEAKKEVRRYILKRFLSPVVYVPIVVIVTIIVLSVKNHNDYVERERQYLLEQEAEAKEEEAWNTWKEDNAKRVLDEGIETKCYTPINPFEFYLPEYYEAEAIYYKIESDRLMVNEICLSPNEMTLTLPVEYTDKYEGEVNTAYPITYEFGGFSSDHERALYVVYKDVNKIGTDTISVDLEELLENVYEKETEEILYETTTTDDKGKIEILQEAGYYGATIDLNQ